MEETEVKMEDSILDSVKKLLGISSEDSSFDQDIIMFINSAFFTMREIGALDKHFTVTSNKETYEELFEGEDAEKIPPTKIYLYHKVRLGFDPPMSTAVLECLKKAIEEDEFRLSVWRKEVSE